MKAAIALLCGLTSIGLQQPATNHDRPTITPQACVQAARDAASARMRETRPMTGEAARRIENERIEAVRSCAKRFDPDKASPSELPALAEMYVEAQLPDLAERTIARGLTPGLLEPLQTADLLATAVRGLLRQPKSVGRNARAEKYMAQLDALPSEAMDRKMAAHLALNSYYRGDDIDEGIIRHSTWIIDTAPRLSADARRRYASSLIAAYVYLAEALAGRGEHERAIALLKRAPIDLSDIPGVENRTRDTLNRYLLVGTPAAPVTAPTWLNAPAGTTTLDMKGAVTLLQFTAHWCGPCRESYPGIQRLRARFAGRPFRVVLATELYGYFDRERELSAEQETARDRDYFAQLGLEVPIAISPLGRTTINGRPEYKPSPNAVAYEVSGIPQINIIDATGRIRLIMVGYDDANEDKLAAFIERLLGEKSGSGLQPIAFFRSAICPA